jgi:hypothetical protein
LQPHEKKKYIPKKVEKEKKVEKLKTRIKNLKKKQKRYVRVADRTEKEPTYLQKQLNFKAKVIKNIIKITSVLCEQSYTLKL